MRKIVFTRPDGGVSVVSVPVDTDAALAAAQAKLPVDAANIQIVDESVIPTDRTFRDSWVQSGGGVVVDLPKARDIQEVKIRAAQRKKIRDILEREALGDNVAAEKASIRAVNPRTLVDNANDVAELKSTFPASLR